MAALKSGARKSRRDRAVGKGRGASGSKSSSPSSFGGFVVGSWSAELEEELLGSWNLDLEPLVDGREAGPIMPRPLAIAAGAIVMMGDLTLLRIWPQLEPLSP